jgi:hypothetical protein
MSKPSKPRPLVSRGGQLTLYIFVVVLALLAGTYAGVVYCFMVQDVASILAKNGRSGSHQQLARIALWGSAAMVVPVAVIALFALCGWGLCLLGLRRLPPSETSGGAGLPNSDRLTEWSLNGAQLGRPVGYASHPRYHAGMVQTRHRRRMKRVVMYAAAAALLLAWYITSYPIVAVFFPVNTNPRIQGTVEFVYAPLLSYLDEDLPGARHCQRYMQWCGYEFQQALRR